MSTTSVCIDFEAVRTDLLSPCWIKTIHIQVNKAQIYENCGWLAGNHLEWDLKIPLYYLYQLQNSVITHQIKYIRASSVNAKHFVYIMLDHKLQ